MNKTEWKDYKKNNIKLIWKNIVQSGGCATTLPFKLPFINFLKKCSPSGKMHAKLMKARFWLIKKPIMPCLEYVVTTKCTMACKHCNTFVPYFYNDFHLKFTTFEQFKNDLDILLKAVDYIDYFGFVGGEPLLVKDLDKMIKYAISKKKLHHVFLASNCTILPDEKLLNAMKSKKFAIQLSDYRGVKFKNGVSVKFDEYKKLLDDNNIQYSCPQLEYSGNAFQSMPELYEDIQDKNKVKEMFDCCWGQYCQMLCDGILTQCCLTVFISRNMKLSEEVKKELVNIREKKSSRKLADEIIKFYAKPYSAFCHYCHNDNIQYGLPTGEQVEEGDEIRIGKP